MGSKDEFRYAVLTDGVAAMHIVDSEGNYRNVYILGSKGSAAIIDAGVPATANALIEQLQANSWAPEDFRYIIITHEHWDHYGGAAALKRWSPRAWLLGHAWTAAAIGDHWGRFIAPPFSYGEPSSMNYDAFKSNQPEPVQADGLLWGSETLNIAGTKWQVLHMPGHAAGHIILHDPVGGTAVVGDLLQGRRESLGWLGLFTDIKSQRWSLQRFGELAPALAMGHHTPLTGGDVQAELDAAVRRVADLCDVVRKGLKDGLSDPQDLARLAFKQILNTEPDPIPPYALLSINAALADLAYEDEATMGRQDHWRLIDE